LKGLFNFPDLGFNHFKTIAMDIMYETEMSGWNDMKVDLQK